MTEKEYEEEDGRLKASYQKALKSGNIVYINLALKVLSDFYERHYFVESKE